MSITGTISVPSTATSVSTPTPFEYGEDYAFYDARNSMTPDYYQKDIGYCHYIDTDLGYTY